MKSFRSRTDHAEWAILAILLGFLGVRILAEIPGSKQDLTEAPLNSHLASAVTMMQSPDASGTKPCFMGTDAPDTIHAGSDATCFHLGRGADRLDLSTSDVSLLVESGPGGPAAGDIKTGAGNDTIISRQNGNIEAGAGDDLIFLNLAQDAAPSTFTIDPGPGRDFVDIVDLANAGTLNVLRSGADRLDASTLCNGGGIEFLVTAGSRSNLSGDCDFSIRSQGQPSKDMTAVTIIGTAGLQADLAGIPRLSFSALIQSAEGEPIDRSITLNATGQEYADIRLRTKSSKSIDVSIDGRSLTESSSVFLDIEAPAGVTRLQDAANPDWIIHLNYKFDGALDLSLSDKDGPGKVSMPEIIGQVPHFIIRGCFDHIVMLDGASDARTWSGCASTLDLEFEDAARRRHMTFVKDGRTTRVLLGEKGLMTKRVTILEIGQDIPGNAPEFIPIPEVGDDADDEAVEAVPGAYQDDSASGTIQ